MSIIIKASAAVIAAASAAAALWLSSGRIRRLRSRTAAADQSDGTTAPINIHPPPTAEDVALEESASSFSHDLRFGFPPDGSEILKDGIPSAEGWDWTHGRRVGDTALQLSANTQLQLRLPSALWAGGLTDEPLRTYTLTIDAQVASSSHLSVAPRATGDLS